MPTLPVEEHLDHPQPSRPSVRSARLPTVEASRRRPMKRTPHSRPHKVWGRRLGTVFSIVTALFLVLSACSDGTTSLRKGPGASGLFDSPRTSGSAPSTTKPSGTASTPAQRSPDATGPDGTRSAAPKSGNGKATRLGKLNPPPDAAAIGAPYDPCTVVSWDDFPDQVRPRAPKPRKPSPRAPTADSAFDIACAWLANGPITISADGSSAGSGMFSTWVVWGKDMNVHPPNSASAQFGPAQGSLVSGQTSQGAPMCTGFAVLASGGVAGVSTVNSKAPQVDTCGLVADLLTKIVARHN